MVLTAGLHRAARRYFTGVAEVMRCSHPDELLLPGNAAGGRAGSRLFEDVQRCHKLAAQRTAVAHPSDESSTAVVEAAQQGLMQPILVRPVGTHASAGRQGPVWVITGRTG